MCRNATVESMNKYESLKRKILKIVSKVIRENAKEWLNENEEKNENV